MLVIDAQLSESLTAALAKAMAAASDLTPAMRAIAAQGEADTRLRFETGTGPDGTPWKPSKRALDEGGLTLVESGDLKSSISHAAGPDFAEWGPEASFASAIYAEIHQRGGTIRATPKSKGGTGALKTPFGPRGAVTLPARPYVGLGPGDGDELARILLDHIAKGLQ